MPSTRRSTPTPCEGPRPWARGSREAWGRGATANGYLVPRRNAGGATRGPGPAEMVWCVRARWAGGKATRARSDDSKRRESNNNNKKRRKPKTTSYYKMTDLVCECRSSCDENDPRHTVRVSPSPHPSPLTTVARSPNLCPLCNLLFAALSSRRGVGSGGSQDPEHQSQPFVDPYPIGGTSTPLDSHPLLWNRPIFFDLFQLIDCGAPQIQRSGDEHDWLYKPAEGQIRRVFQVVVLSERQ